MSYERSASLDVIAPTNDVGKDEVIKMEEERNARLSHSFFFTIFNTVSLLQLFPLDGNKSSKGVTIILSTIYRYCVFHTESRFLRVLWTHSYRDNLGIRNSRNSLCSSGTLMR